MTSNKDDNEQVQRANNPQPQTSPAGEAYRGTTSGFFGNSPPFNGQDIPGVLNNGVDITGVTMFSSLANTVTQGVTQGVQFGVDQLMNLIPGSPSAPRGPNQNER